MITNDWLSLCSGSSQGCTSSWNHLGSTPTTEVLQVWYNLEWKFVPGDLEKVGGGGILGEMEVTFDVLYLILEEW